MKKINGDKNNYKFKLIKKYIKIKVFIRKNIRSLLIDESDRKLIKYIVSLVCLLLSLFVFDIVGHFATMGAQLGTFGDFIGGVANPLLTFLTFICLIKTIFMQREELKMSRAELTLTRKEYTETQAVIRKQSVESTFYNGVNLHHEIVNNLYIDLTEIKSLSDILSPDQNINIKLDVREGRGCFKGLLDVLTFDAPTQEIVVERYRIINGLKNEWLGHYFRNLYRIIKIIDDLPADYFTIKQKEEYCHTLRAQLSSNELAVLMLNCYGNVCDRGEFRMLLSRYAMLEHLPLTTTDKPKTVRVAGAFDVSYPFIKEYLIDEKTIAASKRKLDLVRHPHGAFGKNLSIDFPKRFD